MTRPQVIALVLGLVVIFGVAMLAGVGPEPRPSSGTGFSEVRTAAYTVVAGALVIVIGQIAQRFFMEPIQEQRRIIGEISFAAIYYHNVSNVSPSEIRVEAQQTLRKLSAQLYATLWAIRPYGFFEWCGWVAKREDVNAATGLIGWSNDVVMKDTRHAALYRSRVIKALGLPEQT